MSLVREWWQEKVTRAVIVQNEWLEDVLAGLLAAGCTHDEIEVQRFLSEPTRVVVAVRGVPKYEHKINVIMK